MHFQTVWEFAVRSLFEYTLFLPLDLWTKIALKKSRNEVERSFIWASEAQLLLVGSLVALLWHKVLPVIWLILACCAYLSSYGILPGILHTLSVTGLKQLPVLMGTLIWTAVFTLWFSCSVVVGNGVDFVFTKLFSFDRRRSMAVESFLISLLKGINDVFINAAHLVTVFSKTVSRTCTYWAEVFSRAQWDCSPEELVPKPLSEFTSDRLLCHPECELSQKGTGDILDSCSANGNPQKTCNLSGNNETVSVRSYVKESVPVRVYYYVTSQITKVFRALMHVLQSLLNKIMLCHNNQLNPFGSSGSADNLCFMNTVVHCLTQEEGLVSMLQNCLNDTALNRLSLSVQEIQFLHAFRKLLTCDNEADAQVLVQQFQNCCSTLIPSLVSKPGSRQQQQDAAEFALWLLNNLHQCLNSLRESRLFISRGLVQRYPFVLEMIHPSPSNFKKQIWSDKVKNTLIHLPDNLLKNLLQFSYLEWAAYEKGNMSPVSEGFTGQMIEVHQCVVCYHMSVHSQIFTILPVAVPIWTPSVSLKAIMDDFLKVDDIEVEEGCACLPHFSRVNSPLAKISFIARNSPAEDSEVLTMTPTENKHLQARTSTPLSMLNTSLSDQDSRILSPINTVDHLEGVWTIPGQYGVMSRAPRRKWLKRTFLSKAPKYLIIQLLRFQYDNKKGVRKIHQAVDIPLFNFFVPILGTFPNCWGQPSRAVICQQEYELFGVIVHLGADCTSCGHYVAYVRHSDNGEWSKFDGSLSKVVDMSQELSSCVLKENAYLLFYKQSKCS